MATTSGYSQETADKAVQFFTSYAVHTKGEWTGKPLKLEKWQEHDIIRPLFGTLNSDGFRQYRTALIGIPRKAGKSTLGAAIALKLLFADKEPGAEVYSAAADREQARIVFEMARGMVEASPGLSARTKVYRNSLVVPKTGSTYKVISAEAYSKHGLSPHGVVVDELHAQPNRELWDVLTTGQGARRQPLTLAITTAGFDRESICWELFDYGRKVNSRVIEDPTFFFRWWGVDEGEQWDDEEVWAKAQPNLDVSVSRDFLRAEAHQAKHQPARQNTFRRLYLNEWTQAETRWIDIGIYDASAGMVDELALAGRRCCGGLDLATSTDIAALNWTFPDDSDGYDGVWRFWIPEEKLSDLDKRTAGQASVWVRNGWLTATPGNVIDYTAIIQQIDEDARRFNVHQVAYDRWGMHQLSQLLTDEGLEVVQFGQGFASMSAPTKEMERLLYEGKYRHGGNPVARWMMDNVVLRQDPAGNVKIDKAKSVDKVDGWVAAVMALNQAQHRPEVKKSRVPVSF